MRNEIPAWVAIVIVVLVILVAAFIFWHGSRVQRIPKVSEEAKAQGIMKEKMRSIMKQRVPQMRKSKMFP